MAYRPYKSKKKIKKGFRSKLEERISLWLTSSKLPWEYEPEKFTYIVPAQERTYTPDFRIGDKVYLEVKGRLDLYEERKKLLDIKQSNPTLDLRVLCPYDRKVGKNKRCSDWLRENGFKFFIGETPPKDWFN